MNEKYEIIIKDNGEEIKRVSAKGFLLTATNEKGIYSLLQADRISGLELALLTNANEEHVDEMWESCGVTRKEREKICELARMTEWLNGEYKTKKHFTEVDKAVLRALDKIQWVARDYDNSVYGYIKRPYKNGLTWNVEDGATFNFSAMQNISSATFTDIKWEDEEPTSRAEILGDEEA